MLVVRNFCGFACFTLLIATLVQPSFAVNPVTPQANGYYTSTNDGGVVLSAGSVSPDQMLERVNDLGQSGKTREALEIAKRAYSQGRHDPRFVIRYITSLTEIIGDAGTKFDQAVLNAAIEATDALNKTRSCSGQSDAELSYKFMVAIGKLASKVEGVNLKIAGQLYSAEGKIAQNLRTNPGYPNQSLEYLGGSLVNLAKAKAIKGDQASSMQAIVDAFEIGYIDFESVAGEMLFEDIDQVELNKTIRTYRNAYRRKVRAWSERELANFSKFQIAFDVANINGGRINADDYKGKIMVVDLWATWCQPCRQGIPHFVRLHKEFGPKGVAVVGVSLDDDQDPASAVDTVKTFAMDNDVDYAVGVGTALIKAQIPGRVLLPTTLFVDQNGTVRYIANGYHNYTQLEAITKQLIAQTGGVVIESASK